MYGVFVSNEKALAEVSFFFNCYTILISATDKCKRICIDIMQIVQN